MKKIRMWAFWTFATVAEWALAVAGSVFGIGWAGNVFKFLAIVATALSIFVAASVTLAVVFDIEEVDFPQHPARRAARYVDASMSLFLASQGWFFYAALYVVQVFNSFWYSTLMERDDHAEQGGDE